jgi:hypothetical protein
MVVLVMKIMLEDKELVKRLKAGQRLFIIVFSLAVTLVTAPLILFLILKGEPVKWLVIIFGLSFFAALADIIILTRYKIIRW